MSEYKTEKIFPEGITFFRKHEKAPAWVKGAISVNPVKFGQWMKANLDKVNSKGYLMLDLKQSKEGKLYLEVNTYAGKNEQPKNDESELGNALMDEDVRGVF